MEAATEFCWFMSLAGLETHIPNFSASLSPLWKENIFEEVTVPELWSPPHPGSLLSWRLQSDSKQEGRHADLKEQWLNQRDGRRGVRRGRQRKSENLPRELFP